MSLSSILAENKAKYYKVFTLTENRLNHGESTFFVIQIMEFFKLAQDSVMSDLERKQTILKRAGASLINFRDEPYMLSKKEETVLYLAVQHYLFDAFAEISLSDIFSQSGVGSQTARKYIVKLEEKGLLKAVFLKPLKFVLTSEALEVFDIADG